VAPPRQRLANLAGPDQPTLHSAEDTTMSTPTQTADTASSTASAAVAAAAAASPISWFEIPALDLDRAQRFYEALLDTQLRREPMGPAKALAVFPYAQPGVGGCLMAGDGVARPAADGALIYLDAGPALDPVLARVAGLGGRITTPRVDLPDGMGCFAHVLDSEGNRVGLHAMG
jgi:predicted enzyme related to lactoylglutathione lyase